MGGTNSRGIGLRGLIGLLVGSLGIGSLGSGCQKKPKNHSEVSVNRGETRPQSSPDVQSVMVSTRERSGGFAETFVFPPLRVKGLENATLKIFQDGDIKRLKNFQLSLNRPGMSEQVLEIECNRMECFLAKNTVKSPIDIKNLLTIHLQSLVSHVKKSQNKIPLYKNPGLNLVMPELSEGAQLMVLISIMFVFISVAVIVSYSCFKIYGRIASNRAQVRQAVEMAAIQAGLPVTAAREISERAVVVVIGPNDELVIGRGDPVSAVGRFEGENQHVINLYQAVVNFDRTN